MTSADVGAQAPQRGYNWKVKIQCYLSGILVFARRPLALHAEPPIPNLRNSAQINRSVPLPGLRLTSAAAGRASTTQSAYHLLGTVQRSNPGEQRTDVTPSASRIKHEHQPQTKVSSPPIAPQSLGPAWESQSRRTHQYCLGIRRLPQRAWMSSNVTACSDYLHLPR